MPIARGDLPRMLARWCLGNEDAARFLLAVAEMARLADDIADGDAPDPHAAMAALLSLALNDVQANRFYRSHIDALAPALALAAVEWSASERFAEARERKTRIFGFVYRESVERVAHLTALILGGTDHAARVIMELHEAAHAGGETLEEWEAEHGALRA